MTLNFNDIDPQVNNVLYNELSDDTICQYYTQDDFNALNLNNRHDLKIISLNIRSLNKHHDELIALLSNLKHKFQIICLEECWLSDENSHMYQLEGYVAYHCLRPEGRIHGGVSIYITEGLTAEHIQDVSVSLPHIETLFLKIKLNKSKTLNIGAIYRPPNADPNMFINNLSYIVSSFNTRDECIITGDFNIDLLKIENNDYPMAKNLVDAMNTLSLSHVITKPTRITNNSSTLIDNIFTSAPMNFISGILDVSISDHLPTILIQKNILTQGTGQAPATISYRLINDRTLLALGDCLNESDFSAVYSCNDSSVAFRQFSALLVEKFNYYCPIKTKTISPKKLLKPWITPNILQLMKRRDNLYRLHRNGVIPLDTCKRYRNFVTKEIKKSKKQYFTDVFNRYTNDTKKTWNIINNILRPSNNKLNSKIKEIISNNNIYTDKGEIANTMNSYFCNIGKNINDSINDNGINPTEYIDADLPNSFFFVPTSTNSIKNVISSLKNKKAKLTEIPVQVIKYLSPIISPIISHIINISLNSGQFPDELKIARVTPIHKAGDKTNMSNYRPISILPTFSKIFEKIVYYQLYSFLERHNILTNCQYGFRNRKSTTQALLNQCQYLYSKIDNDEYVISLFLDFRKAFDCVDHEILMGKLERYGIRGITLRWFKSYLTERKQYTIIDGNESMAQNISHGVPQGSILGPLLFLLFINDLPTITPFFKYILFADDSTLSTSFKKCDADTVAISINHELSKIYNWLNANKISVNTDKTKFIIFSYKNPPTISPIFLGNSQITETSSMKFLGVTFDKHLTFRYHVDNIAKKLSRSIGILYKLSHYLPQNILKKLYYTMIHPFISYGIEAWYSTYKNVTHRIFVLQKRAIRAINHLDYNAHTSVYFNENAILKLEDIYNYQNLMFMYKLKNSQLNDASLTITLQNDIHNHRTRRRNDIAIPQLNKRKSQFCISYVGAKLWNSMPDELKSIPNLTSFSKDLKINMLNEYLIT